MARWIDRTALWTLATGSALALMLLLTQGQVVPALLLTFSAICALRYALKKVPDGRFVSRAERTRRSMALLKQWALMDEAQAVCEIRRTLPDFIEADRTVVFVSRLPGGEALSANDLLHLWKSLKPGDAALIIVPCKALPEAFSLAGELAAPTVRLIDQSALIRRLSPVVRRIPEVYAKSERRSSLRTRVARWLFEIRPVRTGLYALFSALLYLCTHSAYHLIIALLFAALTVCHLTLKTVRSAR